ncbi:hypothetical protein KIP88_36950 [Bradyrhizobium sp. SRL28]|uniref:hypothetical protein n=1 Tax=Bradyrhizobium sp. SRL28 TaxID=2836178 RepID=UPI001BDF1DBA|nr:hypothetical protein [Bradyrhizobium sp. SRL28]MBT1516051.1 hypothetical protein [Bradyrhizobium sp. SRL28]
MDQGFSSCRDATSLQIRDSLRADVPVEITAFGLDRASEAVAHAANSGPFKMTVIEPR